MTPEGVQAARHGRFCTSRPDVGRGEAVDVFGRIDRIDDAGLGVVTHPGRQGRLHQDSVDVAASIQLRDRGQHLATGASAATRTSSARMPASPAVLSLLRT